MSPCLAVTANSYLRQMTHKKPKKKNKGGKILLIQSSHATDPQVFSTYFKKIIAIKEVFF